MEWPLALFVFLVYFALNLYSFQVVNFSRAGSLIVVTNSLPILLGLRFWSFTSKGQHFPFIEVSRWDCKFY